MLTRVFIVLFLLGILANTHAQKIVDVSPDGKETVNYTAVPADMQGKVITSSNDIPFGTTPSWTAALERQVGGMAWGDYDGDGDLDLAVGCYFSNSFPPVPNYEVMIYRNENGMLGNNPAWISTDMKSTTDVKFADIDQDGRIDLLAANGDNSFVPSVIYKNSSTGLSNSPSWTATQNAWAVGAAFADVDGDGDLDMTMANQGNSSFPNKPIATWFNDAGNFTTTPNWYSADAMITNNVAFGDVDLSSLRRNTIITTQSNNGSSYQLPMVPVYSIDTVLVNGQLVTEYCYGKVDGWISLKNKPAIGAQIVIKYRSISKGDMAASKWVNFESGVYFNNNGTMGSVPGWTTGNTVSRKGIAWDDFDRDGYQDLAIGGNGAQNLLYKNNNGTITGPIWTSNSVNPSVQELITGDVDGDGYPELAVVGFGTKRIEIFKNRNGVLDTSPTWLYIAGTSATSIAFGDMNGDGLLDLAVGTARSPVVVFLNQGGFCKTVSWKSGWNLIGVPLTRDSMSVSLLFPTATSSAFAYNNGYQQVTQLVPGKGYWLRFANQDSISLCGNPVSNNTINLVDGWNLVSVFGAPVEAGAIITTPAGIINSGFFSFDNGYIPVTTLLPGKSYWVRSSATGSFTAPISK